MGIKKRLTQKNNWLRILYLVVKNFSWKGFILFLAGAFALFGFTQLWLKGFASLNWQTTEGKIITSHAVACSKKHYRFGAYQANIIYEYSVNKVLYSSNNITFTTDSFTTYCGNADKMMKQYPLDMSVLVYYDHENPKNAVLRPGGTNIIGTGFSLAMLIYGTSLLISESSFPKFRTIRYLKNRMQMNR